MNVNHFYECVEPFMALGFTEMEATVYAYLVENSPATGYRAAQGLGSRPFHRGAVWGKADGSDSFEGIRHGGLILELSFWIILIAH